MTQKIFLTSFIAMGIVANAYAEPSNTGEFPNDGLMQEDYTYTNAATSANMDGVYEGTVNATAEYENILYQLAAGQYLPQSSETPTTCDQNGYYCAGDQNGVNYSTVGPQGLTQCPNGYANSDTGASGTDDCYRTCNGNVTMAHATGVTGNDYYGNGADTCEPTGCTNGWHLSNGDATGLNIDTSINYTARYARADSQYTTGDSGSCAHELGWYEDCSENQEYADLGINEYVSVYSYGRIYGVASCSSTTSPNSDLIYTYMVNGNKVLNGEMTMEEFVASLLAIGTPEQDARITELVTSYSNGDITENELNQIMLSEFGISTMDNIDADSPGSHCWCKFNGYKPNGGTRQNISSAWVAIPDIGAGTYSACMNWCVFDCAFDFGSSGNSSQWYAAMINSLGEPLSVCEANRIKINWADADAKDISDNEAGITNYGKDIRTPVNAATKPGKRFTGWRFSAPSGN